MKGYVPLIWTSVFVLGMARASPARPADAARTASLAPMTDGVLGRFVGDWRISGPIMGRQVRSMAEVRARFGGAFLELHVVDPSGRNPYEARVFFGRDAEGGLVVHWLDTTGGETSRTLGRGRIESNAIVLDFPYPDGDFRDRLSYDAARDRWRLLIETGPAAQPTVFADWAFDRAS